MAKQSADQVSDWNGQSGERWVANQARLNALVSVFGLATIEAAAPATGGRVLDIGCGARLRDRSALSRPDEEHAAIAYAARPERPMDDASRCIRARCRAACTASALC